MNVTTEDFNSAGTEEGTHLFFSYQTYLVSSWSWSYIRNGYSSDFVPAVFRWEHGGRNVYITGTFNNWDKQVSDSIIWSNQAHFFQSMWKNCSPLSAWHLNELSCWLHFCTCTDTHAPQWKWLHLYSQCEERTTRVQVRGGRWVEVCPWSGDTVWHFVYLSVGVCVNDICTFSVV